MFLGAENENVYVNVDPDVDPTVLIKIRCKEDFTILDVRNF